MKNQTEYPSFFARFYDVMYDDLRSEDDADYFLNKIKKARGPVLEVGVGTGRFFIEALKSGADVYGIDISPEMLKVLKSKLPDSEHHRIAAWDVCKMKLEKQFDLIIAPFRVFQNLMKIEDQLNALNNIYNHLNPGGVFIFDLFAPNLKMILEGLDNVKDFDGEYEKGKKLQRFVSMNADTVNQCINVTFKLVWNEEGEEFSDEWQTEMRFFFRYEIEHLLARSKFKSFKIFGDFDENFPDQSSREFIIHCKKSN